MSTEAAVSAWETLPALVENGSVLPSPGEATMLLTRVGFDEALPAMPEIEDLAEAIASIIQTRPTGIQKMQASDRQRGLPNVVFSRLNTPASSSDYITAVARTRGSYQTGMTLGGQIALLGAEQPRASEKMGTNTPLAEAARMVLYLTGIRLPDIVGSIGLSDNAVAEAKAYDETPSPYNKFLNTIKIARAWSEQQHVLLGVVVPRLATAEPARPHLAASAVTVQPRRPAPPIATHAPTAPAALAAPKATTKETAAAKTSTASTKAKPAAETVRNSVAAQEFAIPQTAPTPAREIPAIADSQPLQETAPKDKLDDPANIDPIMTYLCGLTGRVLKAEEEVELAKAIEAGVLAEERLDIAEGLDEKTRRQLSRVVAIGKESKRAFVESNQGLVVTIARRYAHRRKSMAFSDLTQEGTIGMIRAVEKFDYTKGYKFSTFATWWIRQAIIRAIADQSRTIRVPVDTADTIHKAMRTYGSLADAWQRTPTFEEVGTELDLSPEKVAELIDHDKRPLSFDMPIGDSPGDSETLSSFIKDGDAADPLDVAVQSTVTEQLMAAIDRLPARLKAIVLLKTGLSGEKLTDRQIAQKLYGNDNATYVNMQFQNVLARLAHPTSGLSSDMLEGFLGD